MILVLDACAMIAYLADEPGASVVGSLLADADNRCSAHAINICEVYYDALRRDPTLQAHEAANDAIVALRVAGIETHEDLDEEMWREAATCKAWRRMSLADAFAVALTNRLGATLVTSDHHEFDAVAADGICPVLFIR